MEENSNSQPSIEIISTPTPPSLSDAALADYNCLLNDPAFARDFPEHHAALKASVDNAIAATGQNAEPSPDARSPAQRLHDERHGVSFASDGKVELPKALATVIEREAEAEPADREAVVAQLKAAGLGEELVRLSVGIEAASDIIEDLAQALRASQRT